ncbi:MAG TPA: alpha/beta hydrolase [Dermatophilaceae bacterium]|nr:alpha/beta hydrolase [Dermatophilaceae bacterium]
MSWWRWARALAWLLVPAWIWGTRADVLLAGHPAYAVLVTLAAVAGLALIAIQVRARRAKRRYAAPPDVAQPSRRGRRALRTVGRAIGVVATIGALVGLVLLRPYAATAPAVTLTSAGSDSVSVVSTPTSITLTPKAGAAAYTSRVGLVFQPGALVDPRAYVPLLARVAADGHLVVIVKQPLSFGLLALGAPDGPIAEHPEVTRWAVGGHSLGGVAASMYAASHDDRVSGLVLWASYPASSLADRTGLAVASISGTADGLARPTTIEARRGDLPPTTVFTPVAGAVHAYFGDYGEQAGDGIPTVSREQAQTAIVDATLALLARA